MNKETRALLYQELANTSCTGPENDHFMLCEPGVLFFFFSFLSPSKVIFVALKKNRFCRLEQFQVDCNTEQTVRGFPPPLPPPPLLNSIPVYSGLHPSSTLGTAINPRRHIITPRRPRCASGYPLCVLYSVYSVGFNKCITPCTRHYGVIRSSFTALKYLRAPPIHPSLSLPTLILLRTLSFDFSRTTYSWNHTGYSLFGSTSFTQYIFKIPLSLFMA